MTTACTTVLCSAALTFAMLAGNAAAAKPEGADLSRLAWLGGCWKSANGEPGSVEHWMPLAGGTMLGMGRTVRQGRTVEHEFMEIRAAADGAITFVAHPSNQKTAAFPLLRMTDNEVVFENMEHDFPQRVAYRLDGESKLAARIEGMRKGTLRIIDFPMVRISCDSPASSLTR